MSNGTKLSTKHNSKGRKEGDAKITFCGRVALVGSEESDSSRVGDVGRLIVSWSAGREDPRDGLRVRGACLDGAGQDGLRGLGEGVWLVGAGLAFVGEDATVGNEALPAEYFRIAEPVFVRVLGSINSVTGKLLRVGLGGSVAMQSLDRDTIRDPPFGRRSW